MQFKTRFSPSEQVISPEGVTPAQQQFKDDCDINQIVNRFQKTGAIDHAARYQPEYGLASSATLHESMNLVARAQSMFNELPSKLRRRFNGDPRELLAFVQNPANEQEAKDLGLALSDVAQAQADAVKAAAPIEPSGTASAATGGQSGVSAGGDPQP